MRTAREDGSALNEAMVCLVGAGPGDPGLLTIKGLQRLRQADVVIYDALVSERILNFARPDAEIIFAGKRGGTSVTAQDEINTLLLEKARGGKRVVRLKGGDPFVFGRGGEEAVFLTAQGISWEVVPGVSSAVAAPAYAGIPVTHRDFVSTVTFVAGHEDPQRESSRIHWPSLASSGGTLVFLMGMATLEDTVRKLVEQGLDPATPCAVIMWGTLPRQKTVTAPLERIAATVRDSGLASPAVFVAGSVVALRDKLQWFEHKPLFGKRIVVTRSREQASALVERLESLGAETLEFPAIRIAPPEDWSRLDSCLQNLKTFDWLVFTSTNAVDLFVSRLRTTTFDIRDLKGLKLAAIGSSTKRCLEEKMLRVDLCPEKFVSESLLKALEETREVRGRRFLLPRADQARSVLKDGLSQLGADVTEVVLYRTVPDSVDAGGITREIMNGSVDWVTFASSTTVKYFMERVGIPADELRGRFKVASIGPVTSDTVRKLGLDVRVQAPVHTIQGLVEALVESERGRL